MATKRGMPRFPAIEAWPLEMRADAVAALLDYTSTMALARAVARNEAPRASRVRGPRREPVWHLDAIVSFLASRSEGQEGLAPRTTLKERIASGRRSIGRRGENER